MSAPESTPELEQALARFIDGEPEPGDAALIVEAARRNPAQLKAVTGLLAIDDLLRQHAESPPEAFVQTLIARIEAEQSGPTFVSRVGEALGGREKPRARVRAWLPWLAAAAAAIVAVVGWWPAGQPGDAHGRMPPDDHGRDVLALLVNEATGKFAQGAAPDAVSFSKGRYELTEGAVHLRFRNGTDAVFVAPARFVIDDLLRVEMESGSVRAFVPPSAHGFVVSAPGVRYRDLGTEFGVTVQPASGESKLHVFEGEVEVIREGELRPQATIIEGQSISVTKGVMRDAPAPDEGQFLTPGAIALRRWSAWRERMQGDPNLVIYYPFEPESRTSTVLRDRAASGLHVNGAIHGAQWVTGRWPGKSALQFERPGDSVAISIPGEYEAVTLAAWLKIDRLENTMNVVMSSVGWREGGIQWQMDRQGDPAPTSVFSTPKRKPLGTRTPVPTGRWIHWAVTIDRASGKILHYLNGRLASSAQIAPGSRLMPGLSHLGRWEPDNKAPDVRDFRGRIDEFALWQVALSPGQISEIAEAGMPIELPEFQSRDQASVSGSGPHK